MAELFGLSIKRTKDPKASSMVAPSVDDGAYDVSSYAGFFVIGGFTDSH